MGHGKCAPWEHAGNFDDVESCLLAKTSIGRLSILSAF